MGTSANRDAAAPAVMQHLLIDANAASRRGRSDIPTKARAHPHHQDPDSQTPGPDTSIQVPSDNSSLTRPLPADGEVEDPGRVGWGVVTVTGTADPS